MSSLIISFSGREGGNCDQIAEHIARPGDKIVAFRELNAHPCSGCRYECFRDTCPYRDDGVYSLYREMAESRRVIWIVPMYCGNPSALYFGFSERGQDFFMHNEGYEELVKRLYIIGVFGSAQASPAFLPGLEQWFEGSGCTGHVLGLERHRYGQKLEDRLLDVPEVKEALRTFLSKGEPI